MPPIFPTINQIRDRIEQVGRSINPINDQRVARDVDEYQIHCALKYQYIIAGKSSEISGKYQPKENLVYPVEVDGIDSLCFPVQTTNQISESVNYRGPTIPFNNKFEPWAEEIFEYLQDNKNPFQFAYNDSSSKRLYEAAVTYTFKGMHWLMKSPETQDSRWVDFSSQCLRRARILELYSVYNFELIDLLLYGGWDDDDLLKISVDQNLRLNMGKTEFNLSVMKMLAVNYIHKLCIPYEQVH